MRRKTKAFFILILTFALLFLSFSYVNAHSVELDPEELITFPISITNGEGSIAIAESQTGYTLYYQIIEIASENYARLEEIRENTETELNAIAQEMEALNTECDQLKTIYDEAAATYERLQEEAAEETELEAARIAYETAQNNYQNKVTEYNAKAEEYITRAEEIMADLDELTPTYVEDNWVETQDGTFNIDLSQFSGEKAFVVWARLDSSNGTTYYDEELYFTTGTMAEGIAVESISLNKTTLSISEGSSYTLVATISPSDATNATITWSSSNEEVATVENGRVTAVSPGTATITATTANGEFTASCEVTVTERIVINTDTDNNDTREEENSNNPVETKDPTVADGKLPQTGELSFKIILGIIALSIIGIVSYRNIKHIDLK